LAGRARYPRHQFTICPAIRHSSRVGYGAQNMIRNYDSMKGTGFSPYVQDQFRSPALAAEGIQTFEKPTLRG
jgi:hypothetical protein